MIMTTWVTDDDDDDDDDGDGGRALRDGNITFVTAWVVVSAIGGNEIQSLALTDHHRLLFGKIEMTGDLN